MFFSAPFPCSPLLLPLSVAAFRTVPFFVSPFPFFRQPSPCHPSPLSLQAIRLSGLSPQILPQTRFPPLSPFTVPLSFLLPAPHDPIPLSPFQFPCARPPCASPIPLPPSPLSPSTVPRYPFHPPRPDAEGPETAKCLFLASGVREGDGRPAAGPHFCMQFCLSRFQGVCCSTLRKAWKWSDIGHP